MLTNLSFRNFKSWRQTGVMRLAPLTGLFGTNSSGKTSIMQILLMLKQTADSPDRSQVLNLGDDKGLVELGSFRDVLFDHDLSNSLEMKLDWALPAPLQVEDPSRANRALFSDSKIGFTANIGWRSNGDAPAGRVVVNRMSYSFAGNEFGMKPTSEGRDEFDLLGPSDSFKFVRAQGRAWKLPPPSKCYGFPDQVRAYFQNAGFLSDFELALEEMLGRTYYLGPLRDYPKRQYTWAGTRPADMGRRGEKVVDALLASEESREKIKMGKGRRRLNLEERVAKWLQDLGLIHSFSVRPIKAGSQLFQVWVQRHSTAAEVLITDVGFGVSQILPVITLCYYAPPGSTLLLEQPEIHLHPAVQAGLADVFVDAIKTRSAQIIVESHSEHLLRRLQRRIAEEEVQANDAALYFCTLDRDESRLIALDLDMFGTIRNWPEGFFGNEFGEIAQTQEAVMRRKRKATG
jgi:predicted ATPase